MKKIRIIHGLDINADTMREINFQYLFSEFQIENANNINIHFEKYFMGVDSPYFVNLYFTGR